MLPVFDCRTHTHSSFYFCSFIFLNSFCHVFLVSLTVICCYKLLVVNHSLVRDQTCFMSVIYCSLLCSLRVCRTANIRAKTTYTKHTASHSKPRRFGFEFELKIKVGWVLKNSGNSLFNRHWDFSIWIMESWAIYV